ncbi:glycosyltransferase, partial [Roseomonas rosulenta]|uniref:glycosyltransferase n=1 Tax=Roseomonas rosulenta TaxID=2748667 RepID=UPI0018E00C3B
MHVVLDISRFLACGRRKAPSGIDRVEAAYARRWLDAPAQSVTFVARGPRNGYAAVPRGLVADLADRLDAAWAGGPDAAAALRNARRLGLLAMARMMVGRGRARVAEVLARERRTLFLLVSHRLMEQPEPIAELRRAGAAFIPLVHDLIPATHPEYARPGVAMQHLQRLETVAALADGIIVNSAATAAVLRPHLVRQAAPPPLLVAPLGIGRPLPAPLPREPDPYFVVIGTIEPRKNHLMLLHLWRDFAARWGSAAPRLVLVSRRGWENENVLDLLERCTLLRGLVREAGSLPDPEVAALLSGSRALLFPSFAEGYGLPLAEALAAGAPAICSDLAALREVGGDVPEYLDPLDGAAWRRLVLDYAAPDSRARAAQLARLRHWAPPSWEDHFASVDGLLAQVAARGAPAAAQPQRGQRRPALPPEAFGARP